MTSWQVPAMPEDQPARECSDRQLKLNWLGEIVGPMPSSCCHGSLPVCPSRGLQISDSDRSCSVMPHNIWLRKPKSRWVLKLGNSDSCTGTGWQCCNYDSPAQRQPKQKAGPTRTVWLRWVKQGSPPEPVPEDRQSLVRWLGCFGKRSHIPHQNVSGQSASIPYTRCDGVTVRGRGRARRRQGSARPKGMRSPDTTRQGPHLILGFAQQTQAFTLVKVWGHSGHAAGPAPKVRQEHCWISPATLH